MRLRTSRECSMSKRRTSRRRMRTTCSGRVTAGKAAGEDCAASDRAYLPPGAAQVDAGGARRDLSDWELWLHSLSVQVLCAVCLWRGIFVKNRAIIGMQGARDVVFCACSEVGAGVAGADEHYTPRNPTTTGSSSTCH